MAADVLPVQRYPSPQSLDRLGKPVKLSIICVHVGFDYSKRLQLNLHTARCRSHTPNLSPALPKPITDHRRLSPKLRRVTGQFRTLLVGLTGLAHLTALVLARYAPSRVVDAVSSLRKLHTDIASVHSTRLKEHLAFLHVGIGGAKGF